MRGKGRSANSATLRKGITPAYAGKRSGVLYRLSLKRDHPRVCGEKPARAIPAQSASGSPPRMRGKADGFGQTDELSGITPAYAGKSRSLNWTSSTAWDHPRVCGEKPKAFQRCHPATGSPPRMRGKVKRRGFLTVAVRITPAYAGKRAACRGRQCRWWDHPRVCGEKRPDNTTGSSTPGSPPRMRGKGGGRFLNRNVQGITPAYAGKRGFDVVHVPVLWDHPRVCGEKTKKIP